MTSDNALDAMGPRRFTFALITDTHLNQGEEECNSPFDVNRLANARMRYVVQDLNTRDVDFVIHLGDLVHPVPAIPHLYERASTCFKEQIAELRHPLHVIPGNHDVGDKPIDWGPAGVVSDAFLALYRQHFGEEYWAFEHKGCHFVSINAQVINSRLPSEQSQREWLEAYLAGIPGQRMFFCTHYPPYLTYRDEGEHYDNLAEPGRSWLLGLLEQHKIEALFAGHVHHFWFHRYSATECYLLPSTAFARQDYSEMYRAEPSPSMQAGRNDAPKLGYFVVDVYENGHRCRLVRTGGQTASPGAPPLRTLERVQSRLPSENWRAPLGFDMRAPWLDIVEIPPSGGLDEFDRKKVRNDYSLMALWQMGVRNLRIPATDLLDPERRARLALLKEHGLQYTLFSFGKPEEVLRRAVLGEASLLDAWEVAGRREDAESIADSLAEARGAGVDVYFSKLRSKGELEDDQEKYYHLINHGFTRKDEAELETIAGKALFDGVVFRASGAAEPYDAIEATATIAQRLDLKSSLHLRMSAPNPADTQRDDRWTANRLAEAMLVAMASRSTRIFADTFIDADRGYFVRHGIIDSYYNPRLGYYVVSHLYGALNRVVEPLEMLGKTTFAGGQGVSFKGPTREGVLVLPSEDLARVSVDVPAGSTRQKWMAINLGSGEIASDPVSRTGTRLALETGLVGPWLLLAED